jgi:hypothetical protein
MLDKETAGATSPEFVELIQAFAKETLEKKPKTKKQVKKKQKLDNKKQMMVEEIEGVETEEKALLDVMARGAAAPDSPGLEFVCQSLSRGLLSRSAAFKTELKAELEALQKK